MGARERLERRLMAKAERNRKVNEQMVVLNACVEQAEEEHLPSATGLRAVHIILQDLIKDRDNA